MDKETQKSSNNLFTALRRLFSSDVIIRNEGGGQLKVIDTDHIQSSGVIQTNSLVDRFHKVYTTSTAYGVNLNLAQNYRSARVQIYADYDAMDTDAIVSSALDIISDECTLKNEQGEVLQIRSSDENIQKILYNLYYSVLNIEFNLWSWIRNMCKYGDFYLKLEIAEDYGVFNVIPFSAYNIAREEGFNPQNPNEVRFKFDPNAAIASTAGYSAISREDETGIFFDNYEMAHFRLTGDVNYLPYGRSYLEPARKLFKQYVLIEDAMLIHRIVRAPEKRVFYVNIGAIPPGEVENFMQRMINKMKKTPLMDPQTGQYNLKYNMQNMLEDIYIPVRGNDATTRIDTAKGLDYNGIEDVQYFREKLFAALKIPKAFMGYEKDLSGKATLAAEDIRFARTIERIQRIAISELTKIGLIHLYANGYTNESAANFTITLTNPSIIYEQERIALFKEKIDLANTALESKLLPRDFIYDKIFQFSEDQYSEMDDMIIEDQKRTFRYNQIVEEGNDPAETGQAFGTPHQLASLYGGKSQTSLDVPTGYDETNPNEPVHLPGRPKKYNSTRGTDASPFGRDPIGRKEVNKDADAGENNLKLNFKGGSPLALENTMMEYLRMRSSLQKINPKNVGRPTSLYNQLDSTGRQTNLYDQPDLLKEESIKEDSEFPKLKRAIKKSEKQIITESENKLASDSESIEEVALLNEKYILDDFTLKIKDSIADLITPLKEDSVKEELLEEKKIIEDYDLQIKTSIVDFIAPLVEEKIEETLLDTSSIIEDYDTIVEKVAPKKEVKQKATKKKKKEEVNEVESLLEEANLLKESTIDKTLNKLNKETLLQESNIVDETVMNNLEDATNKAAENNSTLLKEDSIIEETILNPEVKQYPEKLLQEEKLVEDGDFATVSQPTLLDQDNIVDETVMENIENTTLNPDMLKDRNIVEEQLFESMENTILDSNLLDGKTILEDENFTKKEDNGDMLNEDNIKDDQ
jgi:hypothetical protein